MTGSQPLLSIRKLVVSVDSGRKLDGVDLDVAEGEVHALLGPNGAGKSTLMRALTRQIAVDSGDLTFDGRPLPRRAVAVVRSGMVMAPQNHPIFPSLTIRESLRLRGQGDVEESLELFPELEPIAGRSADKLSGGQRQMLSMAMCLRLRPRILLLDEPSSGLAPKVVNEVFEAIRKISRQGVAVLMVEQNAAQTLKLADTASLLEHGQITLTGDASDLADNDHVRAAYLGV
jgi:branched-chain amino acid transport system ATP-binding protein